MGDFLREWFSGKREIRSAGGVTAYHVQKGLTTLFLDGLEAALEGGGKVRRVVHALRVGAAGLGGELELR